MKHPLSRFAPSPSLASLREAGGGRTQRGGAALARGRWYWEARALSGSPLAPSSSLASLRAVVFADTYGAPRRPVRVGACLGRLTAHGPRSMRSYFESCNV